MPERKIDFILGQPVEVGTHDSVMQCILRKMEPSTYICFTTAHMLVETLQKPRIHAAYANADMILPDGAPVAWCLRILGHKEAECISGPRFTPILLREAARRGISVGFYGGRPDTIRQMTDALRRHLPALKIMYAHSPPFRALSRGEQQVLLDEINTSGTQLLFVGLGSPKQELWMHENARLLTSVSLGVGAAFEFLSGEKYLPPLWIQRLGLTWLIRLGQEPRRLIRRNLYSPVFVFCVLKQLLLGARFQRTASPAAAPERSND